VSTRPLSLVKPGDAPPAAAPVPSSRVELRPWTRLDVEQARAFLMELPASTAGVDLPRAMYLLGLLGGHAQNLLDVLDTITNCGGES
jgi:hypothetical protein